MLSLFSVFDLVPHHLSVCSLCVLFFLMFNSIMKINSFTVFLDLNFSNLSKYFHSLNKFFFCEGLFNLILSLLTFIFFYNLLAVFSYNFPVSSQPSFVMFFSFSIWGMAFCKQVVWNTKGFLKHSVPEGSPISLVVFLFVIEMISGLIRPLTLGVRLCANILAGHLLMSLLYLLVDIFLPFSIFYTLLNVIEIFVAMIQTYIFCTLILLYVSEVR